MTAIFKYQLPSGSTYTMTAPDGTTQDTADKIFYEQVAAAALVGYSAGQSLSSASTSLTKFELSRKERGTAGVDSDVVLAIVGGVSITASVPTLLNVPITNPISQANVVATANGLGPTRVGPLSSLQIRAMMAQAAELVGQDADAISQELGVGKYGLNAMQLEMAGYLKPGTTAQFLNPNQAVAAPNPDNFVDVLSSPTVWTGINGIDGVDALLATVAIQDQIQNQLYQQSYSALTTAGIIQTSVAPAAVAQVGEVYSAAGLTPASILSSIGSSSSQLAAAQQTVGSMLAVGSKLGNQAAAIWAKGVPSLGDISTKAGQLLDQSIAGVKGQITGAIAGVQAQGAALVAQGKAIADNIGKMGKYAVDFANGKIDSLTAGVKQAAAFTGTVDRSTVDAATTKIIGSAKIPSPDFSSVSALNASIQGDIKYAQDALNSAQTQVSSVLAQGQAIAGQVQGSVAAGQQLFNQGAGLAQNIQSTATGLPNKIIGSTPRLF